MQVKEVEAVIPDLVQDFQRFFLLDMTDKKWQEHLQVITQHFLRFLYTFQAAYP